MSPVDGVKSQPITNAPTNTSTAANGFDESSAAAKRLDNKPYGNGKGTVSLGELQGSIDRAQDDDDKAHLSPREAKRWYAEMRGLNDNKMTPEHSAQFENFFAANAVDDKIDIKAFMAKSEQFIHGNAHTRNPLKKEFSPGEFAEFYKKVVVPGNSPTARAAENSADESEGSNANLSPEQKQQVIDIAKAAAALESDKLENRISNRGVNIEPPKVGQGKIKNERIKDHQQNLEKAKEAGVPTDGYENFDKPSDAVPATPTKKKATPKVQPEAKPKLKLPDNWNWKPLEKQ